LKKIEADFWDTLAIWDKKAEIVEFLKSKKKPAMCSANIFAICSTLLFWFVEDY